jgi:antitoxin component YwqK of YwqJK toxin-antitoxin module
MFQSVTQRLIAVSGGIIASLMLCVVLFGLLRGYSYDSDRGLLTIPYADGSRIGVGVCYQTDYRLSVSLTGMPMVQSEVAGLLASRAGNLCGKTTTRTPPTTSKKRNSTTTAHEKDSSSCRTIIQVQEAELWAWHPNGMKSLHSRSRDHKVHGVLRVWYPSGQIKIEMPMKDGNREGRVRWYSQSGELIAQCICKDDKAFSGDFISWYDQADWQGDFFQGRANGQDDVIETKTSHRDGKLIKEQIWNRLGELIGVGNCRDGEKWAGVFSTAAVDDESTHRSQHLGRWYRDRRRPI